MPHKLLLADDSVTIQRVIELTFADEDVQVLVAGNGTQAIERIQQDRPDIVLADVGMPGRDGYDVAAFVKGSPELAAIPVLLLTGAFEPIDDNRARAVRCDGVLVKPFEPQMVINRVRELLARPRPHGPAPGPAVTRHFAPAPPPAESRQAEGESLEDYFDRLDAAFANLGAVPAAPAPRPADEDIYAGPRQAGEPVPGDVRTRDTEPGPASADTAAPWAPDVQDEGAAAPQDHLATAFAALLAAEEGAPLDPSIFAPSRAPVPDEAIDQIVDRVIARMGDESVRQLVIETAERVVREEIERIKRMAAAGEPHGA